MFIKRRGILQSYHNKILNVHETLKSKKKKLIFHIPILMRFSIAIAYKMFMYTIY